MAMQIKPRPIESFPKAKKRKDKAKKPAVAVLQKYADTIFSQFIRKYYCADNGLLECVTCKKWKPWNRDMAAGHYVKRGCIPLRYDIRNVFPQCNMSCNRKLSGNMGLYAEFIIDTQGKEILKELHQTDREWKNGKIRPWRVADYQEVIRRIRIDLDSCQEPAESI